jgi:hypothetical protein
MTDSQRKAREIVDAFHKRGNTGLTQLEHDFAAALEAARAEGEAEWKDKYLRAKQEGYLDGLEEAERGLAPFCGPGMLDAIEGLLDMTILRFECSVGDVRYAKETLDRVTRLRALSTEAPAAREGGSDGS